MSWDIGYDDFWQRDIGYGVPCLCDFPGCNEEINRGLACACGGEPFGGNFCGLYFCDRHRNYWRRNEIGRLVAVCYRCSRNKDAFKPKPDLPEWTHHKETSPSWAIWREEQNRKAKEGRK